MLNLTDITLSYGGTPALKGISLHINEGEIVCLLGANGAGKTSTLNVISGCLINFSGKVEFLNKQIEGFSPYEIVKLGISHVPEGRRIFQELSVIENLEMGAYLRKDNKKIKDDIDWIFELFPSLGMRRNNLGRNLSGGEQQMLAIGRALTARPKLLLLDEPSMGLAPKLLMKCYEVIKRINKNGVTILLVEQNAHIALNISDRGYVLNLGRIQISGTSNELKSKKVLQESYLGH